MEKLIEDLIDSSLVKRLGFSREEIEYLVLQVELTEGDICRKFRGALLFWREVAVKKDIQWENLDENKSVEFLMMAQELFEEIWDSIFFVQEGDVV